MTVVTLSDEVEAWIRREPNALENRWDLYSRLRTEAPYYRRDGSVLISRHEDIKQVVNDAPRLKKGLSMTTRAVTDEDKALLARLPPEQRGQYDAIIGFISHFISAQDDERHTQIRGYGQRVFSARAIAELHGRIEELTNSMLTELAGRPGADMIANFAYKLPLTVISEMLDIPEDVRESMHEATVQMFRFGDAGGMSLEAALPQLAGTYASYARMKSMLMPILERKRRDTGDDLLTRLLAVQEEEGPELLSDDDIIGMATNLLSAGHQTTQDLIGNSLHSLFTDRAEWERLLDKPALVDNAVEEVLRFRSPTQTVRRVAVDKVEVAGGTVNPGESVTCILGSANHDPDAFEQPERFNVERDDVRGHMAFSRGVHFCLGAALSRLEARAVLGALVARFPDADLAVPPEEIEWMPSVFLLGVKQLPVTLLP